MPEYEYRCIECGEVFVQHESLQEHDTEHKIQCPKCQSSQIERVFATPAAVQTSRKA